AAEWAHPHARELVERTPPARRAIVRVFDLRPEPREIFLRVLIFRVEVGDFPIERGERERGRFLAWRDRRRGRLRTVTRRERDAAERDDRDDDVARSQTCTSLRRPSDAAVAPSIAP